MQIDVVLIGTLNISCQQDRQNDRRLIEIGKLEICYVNLVQPNLRSNKQEYEWIKTLCDDCVERE